ncbi:hypothetical protein [Burkholderia seminalis]|uniref:hypothetical protein n=1 Tax=Burkholderia seminalis TaxID=488731 RepID=UPI000F5ADB7A|nr:hypothetical protein [Burkholderia seminalis]
MAKVRFIGDPSGEEHRRGTNYAGVSMPIGEWVDLGDDSALKLVTNPHFEVDGIALLPAAIVGVQSSAPTIDAMAHEGLAKSHSDLADAHAALKADHADLLEAYMARGDELNDAIARIAQLEATLANAAPAAQGEGDGRDADGSGKPGAEEDQGARDGAGGRRRGSASR